MDAAVLPNKGVIAPPCDESYIHLPILSTPTSVKIPITRNHATLKNDSTPYILDIDIEKANPEALKSTANLKNEDSLTTMLNGEITSQIAGKLIQFLPDFTFKDKWVADVICDNSSNRLMKYKHMASFNSRRVALLFSVLSSVGTIILIYLTLRVRMNADDSGNA